MVHNQFSTKRVFVLYILLSTPTCIHPHAYVILSPKTLILAALYWQTTKTICQGSAIQEAIFVGMIFSCQDLLHCAC